MKATWLPARMLAAAVLCVATALAHAADQDSAGRLRAKYAELRPQLSNNQFQKPLYLDSSEAADSLTGDVYAVVDHPFATAAPALSGAGEWCEIMFLPFNTKACRVSAGDKGSILNVRIGRKHDQPVEQAHQVAFSHRVVAQTAEYLQVRLSADQGPIGTRNYRIMLEAVPVEKDRTFIHLSYSYGYGTMGKMAMQVYLGTTGKDKVGFTVAGTQGGGAAAAHRRDARRGRAQQHALLPGDRGFPRRVVGAAAGAVRKAPARLVRGHGALPAPAA